MAMGKIALLTLTVILAGAGLPAAAEPAAGDAPTTRQRPDYRPALTDTAKAAAVQAGAGTRARSGSDAPAAAVARSGKVAAGGDAVPSAKGASTVQAGSKSAAPSAMTARAGQVASAANLPTRSIGAARVDPVPHGGPATTNKDARIAARIDAGPSVPVVRPAQAGVAHLQDLDVAQRGARYQTDVSPSDAMPGASAQAASLRTAAVAGPTLRPTSAGTMSAKGPAKHVALDAPPLKLKGAARVPARRR
jgi:hypothetical protein